MLGLKKLLLDVVYAFSSHRPSFFSGLECVMPLSDAAFGSFQIDVVSTGWIGIGTVHALWYTYRNDGIAVDLWVHLANKVVPGL